ncbi:MAG TPA: hypothetical protein VGS58_13015, partial [Candidatus Sulfopaludibacter sp.]|nr:hypothetical protein [Candidatus Sulfopaludibacter sp.]
MKHMSRLLLFGALLCALAHSVTAQPQEHNAVALDRKILDSYVGRYELAPNFILNITRDGDRI